MPKLLRLHFGGAFFLLEGEWVGGELFFDGFPLIVGEGTAAEGADFGKGGEVGIFGDVPAVVDEAGLFLYLMLDLAKVILTDHCGVVLSSLFILEE